MGMLSKALVIAPYRDEETEEYAAMLQALEAAGYQVTEQANWTFGQGEVDLTDYSDWSQYGLVVVSSHGGQGPPAAVGTGVPIPWGRLPQVWTDPYMRPFKGPDDTDYTYGLKPQYFSTQAAKMPGTLVVFSTCENGTAEWAEALTQAGAGAFVGFPQTIRWDASSQRVQLLLTGLASGKTLGEAAATAPGLYAGPEGSLDLRLGKVSFEATGTWSMTSGLGGSGTLSLSATDNVVASQPCSGTVHPAYGVTTAVSGWIWEGTVAGSSVSGTANGQYTSNDGQGHT